MSRGKITKTMSEIPRSEQEEQIINPEEEKEEYNFGWMKEVEPMMVSLVEELQNRIDSDMYGNLVSDDAGGRIPTLVLRRIINERHPGERLKTYFADKSDSFEKVEFEDGRILIVSEFVQRGRAFARIKKAIQKTTGREDIDFCSLAMDFHKYSLDESIFDGGEHELSVGSYGVFDSQKELDGVVVRDNIFNTLIKELKEEGRSDEEIEVIRQKIRSVREHDIPLMAKRVIEQVWGKEQK